jgi:UrcA family protein
MIMNTNIQTTFRAAAFLLCGAMTVCGLQATARAADEGPLPKETVSYADLDLSKPAGAKTLYGRIVSAARRVCNANGYRDLERINKAQVCTDHAIDTAVKEVGSPQLSALRSAVIHLASN